MGLTLEQRDEFARLLGVDPCTLPTTEEAQALKRQSLPADHPTCEDLNDDDFALLSSILPPEPKQRSAISNRKVIDALIWQHVTGKRFTQLPDRYGTSEAVRKRSERWAIAGAWDHVLDEIDALSLSASLNDVLKFVGDKEAKRGKRIREQRRG